LEAYAGNVNDLRGPDVTKGEYAVSYSFLAQHIEHHVVTPITQNKAVLIQKAIFCEDGSMCVEDGFETFQDSLYINIDDSAVKWKKGQTFRLVFGDPIATGGYNIVFRTDAANILGNGSYGKIIYTILSSELLSSKPIIEITCTDDSGFNFELDILR